MNNSITCLVIDDEPLAQMVMEKLIGKVPSLQLLKKCNNAIDGFKVIQELRPDLVFLDVSMPEMTGMDLVKMLGSSSVHVIITTAYPEFALDGFNLNVTDYLVKPISFERFFQAVSKANQLIDLKKEKALNRGQPVNAVSTDADVPQIKKNFWVKEDKKLVYVNSDEVLLIEGMKDYIKIFLKGKVIVTHMTMSKIASMLPEPVFIRVNRSYLLRKSVIVAIHGNIIETSLGKEIMIGSTYRERIRNEINESIL